MISLELFHYQYNFNETYRNFVQLLKIQPETVQHYLSIPFLPIRFFKSGIIKTGDWDTSSAVCFTSSGTTSGKTSLHYVKDITLYEKSFINGFQFFYGNPQNYILLALLPSYLEREGSSLVYMAEKLIRLAGKRESGFFLNETDKLAAVLLEADVQNKKTILLGVSFALLEFAEKHKMNLKHSIIMETGGMKGRGEEITRSDLHKILCDSLGVKKIHSEYGMTELLSQAYSGGDGKYFCPSWMKVIITSLSDPRQIVPVGQTGRINIIDLANVHSCAFIATEDLGKCNQDGSFEILGRFDNSDVRGCNLLV